MNYTTHHGNNLEILRTLADNSIDAIVTDPPYGLGKEPDALAMLRDWMTGDHHEVKGKGFMGKEWDAFVPQPALWKECLRVLKPGGHLLAFAGTRTQDLMALGLRIAGFEIRDLIAWVYATGFPKSLDVSKAIDKAAGAEREVVGRAKTHKGESGKQTYAALGTFNQTAYVAITAPATDAARQWQGWGTALKPAIEPITVARKPLAGTVAENVLECGTGGLNIDRCRITQEGQELDADAYRRLSSLGSASCIRGLSLAQLRGSLLHIASALRSCSTGGTDHLHSAHDLDGSLLDRALCEHLVARLFPNGAWCGGSSWSVPDSLIGCQSCRRFCDEHTRLLQEAAQCGIPSLTDALERICSGQSLLEHIRECRCIDRLSSSDDFLLAWSFAFLVGEYCSLYSAPPKSQGRWPANVLHDGSEEVVRLFPGEGETSAARFFYVPKASRKDRDGSNHPTVKPTELMRYLCRLVTPPGGVVLDPFMGSGSTGKAAVLEGFRFIGIEREAEYVEIANARIKSAYDAAVDSIL